MKSKRSISPIRYSSKFTFLTINSLLLLLTACTQVLAQKQAPIDAGKSEGAQVSGDVFRPTCAPLPNDFLSGKFLFSYKGGSERSVEKTMSNSAGKPQKQSGRAAARAAKRARSSKAGADDGSGDDGRLRLPGGNPGGTPGSDPISLPPPDRGQPAPPDDGSGDDGRLKPPGGLPGGSPTDPVPGAPGCPPGAGGGSGPGCGGGGCAKNDPREDGFYPIRRNYLKSAEGAGAQKSTQPSWSMGGSDCRLTDGTAVQGHVDGNQLAAAAYVRQPYFIPKSFIQFDVPAKEQENYTYKNWIPTTGDQLTDTAMQVITMNTLDKVLAKVTDPERVIPLAQAAGQAQALGVGNAAADMARNQATSAIEYCSSYVHNFTVEPNNRWNKLRDQVFIPIAFLLLLPGAVLSQAKAVVAQGSPVLGPSNPLDGILRSIIATFCIPATYLAINYGIDVTNSITYTIHSEYKRLFKSDMYKDALAAQVRATPVRKPNENRNAVDLPTAKMPPLLNNKTAFARFEGHVENMIEDPAAGLRIVPKDRADEALASGDVATRLALMGTNAALTASWNLLCAFQLAYFYYLWFAGPIAAAVWVWPMRPLQNALPSWIEGVVTLSFWSLFWNTAVLLMACFKGVDETGTMLMTALNFLATACVKYAFDFAGLVKAAGQEAANKAMSGGGKGGQNSGAGGGTAGSSVPSTTGSFSRTNITDHSGNLISSTMSASPPASGGSSSRDARAVPAFVPSVATSAVSTGAMPDGLSGRFANFLSTPGIGGNRTRPHVGAPPRALDDGSGFGAPESDEAFPRYVAGLDAGLVGAAGDREHASAFGSAPMPALGRAGVSGADGSPVLDSQLDENGGESLRDVHAAAHLSGRLLARGVQAQDELSASQDAAKRAATTSADAQPKTARAFALSADSPAHSSAYSSAASSAEPSFGSSSFDALIQRVESGTPGGARPTIASGALPLTAPGVSTKRTPKSSRPEPPPLLSDNGRHPVTANGSGGHVLETPANHEMEVHARDFMSRLENVLGAAVAPPVPEPGIKGNKPASAQVHVAQQAELYARDTADLQEHHVYFGGMLAGKVSAQNDQATVEIPQAPKAHSAVAGNAHAIAAPIVAALSKAAIQYDAPEKLVSSSLQSPPPLKRTPDVAFAREAAIQHSQQEVAAKLEAILPVSTDPAAKSDPGNTSLRREASHAEAPALHEMHHHSVPPSHSPARAKPVSIPEIVWTGDEESLVAQPSAAAGTLAAVFAKMNSGRI